MRKSRAAVGVSALVLLAAAAVAGCVESREEIPDSENAPEDTESEPDDDETDPGSDEPVCGDDITEQPEECDDGNTDPTDGCIDCVDATCGDGFVWAGEEACDDGVNDGAYAGCAPGCDALGPHCGDGEVNGPEACDDGTNDGSYEGCAPDCLALGPGCGDGEVYSGEAADGGVYEECDDGDGEVGDGCTEACTEETCGDGMVGWSRSSSASTRWWRAAISALPGSMVAANRRLASVYSWPQ